MRNRTSKTKSRSSFTKIWLLALFISLPVGILSGKIIGSSRMAQMQACMQARHDITICKTKFL